ncbi:MAG: hypothetical protein WD342_03230 [Verrucomicrobiales bacterium]
MAAPRHRLVYLLSFPGLDAPLVALGWAALLSRERSGEIVGAAPMSLFLAVWSIYLADRLFDAYRLRSHSAIPPRHRFARRRWRGLAALMLLLVALLLFRIAPRLEPATLVVGAILSLLTAAYFLCFRFISFRKRKSGSFPVPLKEITIGLCFSAGVIVGSGAKEVSTEILILGTGLAALFTTNCLVIALAEAEFDRANDPASHFAARRAAFSSAWLLVVPALCAPWLVFQTPFVLVGTSTLAATALTFFISKRTARYADLTQPLADAVLLVPWLALAFDFARA